MTKVRASRIRDDVMPRRSAWGFGKRDDWSHGRSRLFFSLHRSASHSAYHHAPVLSTVIPLKRAPGRCAQTSLRKVYAPGVNRSISGLCGVVNASRLARSIAAGRCIIRNGQFWKTTSNSVVVILHQDQAPAHTRAMKSAYPNICCVLNFPTLPTSLRKGSNYTLDPIAVIKREYHVLEPYPPHGIRRTST
jgi:hypothetical protein